MIRLISPVAYDRPPQYDRTTACYCGFQKVAYVVKPEKKQNRQTQKCIAACYREERAVARRMEALALQDLLGKMKTSAIIFVIGMLLCSIDNIIQLFI